MRRIESGGRDRDARRRSKKRERTPADSAFIAKLNGTSGSRRAECSRRRCRLKPSTPSLAVWTLILAVVAAPRPAHAQPPPMPPTDLAVGYQTLHIPGQN